MRIPWSRLGKVDGPGVYPVPGLGSVHIDQKVIDAVKQIGGNPWAEVTETTPSVSGVKEYQVTGVFPG